MSGLQEARTESIRRSNDTTPPSVSSTRNVWIPLCCSRAHSSPRLNKIALTSARMDSPSISAKACDSAPPQTSPDKTWHILLVRRASFDSASIRSRPAHEDLVSATHDTMPRFSVCRSRHDIHRPTQSGVSPSRNSAPRCNPVTTPTAAIRSTNSGPVNGSDLPRTSSSPADIVTCRLRNPNGSAKMAAGADSHHISRHISKAQPTYLASG